MATKTISILGCGWLGLPLACHLSQKGYTVKGSTTSESKLAVLEKEGIDSYLLKCDPDLTGERLTDFFNSDVLFLNIPFSRSLQNPRIYQQQIDSIISKLKTASVKFIIFASSTSIYPDHLKNAREEVAFPIVSDRAQTLFDIEKSLLTSEDFQTTVLRFGGLYGGTRKIGKFMTSKKDVIDGPVNLVHLDDCINIIEAIIEKNITEALLNVCSDYHPSRGELYTKASMNLGIQSPEFSQNDTKLKIVNNTKLKNILSYQFLHPNPLDDV